jgi:hypothetical protein
VKTSREEPELQKRRDTGDLVKLAGASAIIAVISIVIAASFICRTNMVSTMPDWSERQMVEMGR